MRSGGDMRCHAESGKKATKKQKSDVHIKQQEKEAKRARREVYD